VGATGPWHILFRVPDWMTRGADLLVGALLGALFGYAFAVYQRWRESVAERKALLALLRDELARIGGQLQPYDVGKAFYQDPIRLSALDQILNGRTLSYRKEPELMSWLLSLRVTISKYNDFVAMANLAQNVAAIPDTAHAQMYRTLTGLNGSLVTARDEVTRRLPKA
jgi:hypothetical protein